jgi:hypothetical protein
VQERAGNTLKLIGISKDFLNRIQMVQQLRQRIDKWDYMKVYKVLHKKRNGHQTEGTTHRMEENLCQLHI